MEKEVNKNSENVNSIYVNFNHDDSYFAVGTQTGFLIINSILFKNNFCCDMNGGICVIEMLNRSSIVAFNRRGKSPRYASNKLIL